MKEYVFNVNGQFVHAKYAQEDVNSIFIPLLEKLSAMQKRKNKRIFVYLVAPPGCGKSTLSLFLEYLSQTADNLVRLQAVGMDGFHYSNAYLKEHQLMDQKGSPATFDVNHLMDKLKKSSEKEIIWPLYDRKIHDVVEQGILVNQKIILLEGNYLLLEEEPWIQLKQFCDYSIFIDADKKMLKDRLIERKIRGGMNSLDAIHFYERSDVHNIDRVKKNKKVNLLLKATNDHHYMIKKEEQ